MEEKLKPCPFCGGEARICIDTEQDWYTVYCTKCNTVMVEQDTEESARSEWNKRTKSKWIDVEEMTPEEYKPVLVKVKHSERLYINDDVEIVIALIDEDGEWIRDNDDDIKSTIGNVISWMNLPK